MSLTDAQRELLEDKFVLWERASREGHMDLRDYNRRAAEALKAALCICSAALSQPDPLAHPDAARHADTPKASFGDVVENGWASENNPTRRGYFVRSFVRRGRMNAGLTWEITDRKGKFWELQPRVIGERLTVIPKADAERQIEIAFAMYAALNYVADMTYCGADAEWHLKPGYDPQRVLDAIVKSEGQA